MCEPTGVRSGSRRHAGDDKLRVPSWRTTKFANEHEDSIITLTLEQVADGTHGAVARSSATNELISHPFISRAAGCVRSAFNQNAFQAGSENPAGGKRWGRALTAGFTWSLMKAIQTFSSWRITCQSRKREWPKCRRMLQQWRHRHSSAIQSARAASARTARKKKDAEAPKRVALANARGNRVLPGARIASCETAFQTGKENPAERSAGGRWRRGSLGAS
jgi:hypothetical protein